MRKVKFFGLLLATGLFSACSDNLENAGNAGENTPGTTEGYVRVAINMPTTSGNSSRSNDSDNGNVDLVDGEANEYNVENAILVFFKGNAGGDESAATFVKAYTLDKGDLSVSNSAEIPQVTEQVSVITEAPKVTDTEQLYVLAILNYDNNVLSSTDGGLKVGTTSLEAGTSTLSALQEKISATIDGTIIKTNDTFVGYFIGGASKNQFTMTNAPLSDKAGTSGNMTDAKAYTLVPVEVYDTEAAATAGEVAKIYVERVVAKVTLISTSKYKVEGEDKQIKVTNANGDETGDIVEITGWYLNVTNNSTKLVRDVTGFKSTNGWLSVTDNTNPERFAGTRGIDASFGVDSEDDYYRIYWAQDCNYESSNTIPTSDFTTYTSTEGTFTPGEPAWNLNLATSTADNACYCLENTMNYTEQKDDRTTGVLIKTNYYTKFLGDNEATKRTFFVCGTSSTKYPETLVGDANGDHTDAFVDQIIVAANKLITNDNYKLSTTDTKGLSLKSGLKSGTYTDVTKVFTFAETDTDSEKYKTQLAAVKAAVGGRISCYIGGENFYYSSLIRHFQDSEGVNISGGGVASAADYKLGQLGRYGVVRNNWYEIDIQSIGGPGAPDVETPGGNPDDSSEGYINCTINVLSWAKRSQGVDL